MPARVFISCGQATDEERGVASDLEKWFRSEAYDPYVAVQVQTIGDLNAGIIGALKASDYYLFVNFPRETVVAHGKEWRRGSLYSHQELAIAYAFGFDHFLVVNHKDVKHEGVQKFIVSNVPEFERGADVLPLHECFNNRSSVSEPGRFRFCPDRRPLFTFPVAGTPGGTSSRWHF